MRIGEFNWTRDQLAKSPRTCLPIRVLVPSTRILTNKVVAANDGKPLPLYQKALSGLTAGAIGASVGSPADLAPICMQADATLPASQWRNYKNAFHALYIITADKQTTIGE